MGGEFAGLVGDAQAIGAMTDPEFTAYWEALGTVVRIAAKAGRAPQAPQAEAPAVPGRDPTSTLSATTELAWQPDTPAPVPARAFGFTGGR